MINHRVDDDNDIINIISMSYTYIFCQSMGNNVLWVR